MSYKMDKDLQSEAFLWILLQVDTGFDLRKMQLTANSALSKTVIAGQTVSFYNSQ